MSRMDALNAYLAATGQPTFVFFGPQCQLHHRALLARLERLWLPAGPERQRRLPGRLRRGLARPRRPRPQVAGVVVHGLHDLRLPRRDGGLRCADLDVP